MLLLYAAAKSIPQDLRDAATIDGANAFQTSIKIVIPLMTPVLKICVIMLIIGPLREFDMIFTMTRGGPAHASEMPSTLMISTLFSKYQYGYGSSMAVFIVIECLILTVIVQIYPLIYLFLFSLKSNSEIFHGNVAGLPENWLWSNYKMVLANSDMPLYFLNSLIVTSVTILGVIIPGATAGYAIQRMHWKLSKVVLIIFTYRSAWNELMFAFSFISKKAYKTIPIGILALNGRYAAKWGPIGAALLLAVLPSLLIYLLLSKYVQDSLRAGAVKG